MGTTTTTAPPRSPLSGSRASGKPGLVLGVLTAVNVLNYLDRYVAAAVLPLILVDMRLTDGQGGLLQSTFILTYSVVSPAIGWLGDRTRRLSLAGAGVLVWSAATVGSGVAQTLALLLAARAMVGMGEASYGVVTPSLISDLYPPARRGRALAIFYAAIPVGTALAYVLGGRIGVALGWRAAFLIVGAPGILLGLTLLILREPARGALDAGRATLAAATAGGGGVRGPTLRDGLRALGARRSYVFNTAAQTIYTFSMGGLAYWMPTYLHRTRGLSLEAATSAFGTVLVLAGFLGTLIGGQLGDRLAERVPGAHFAVAGWCLVASLPFTLLALLSSSPAILWPAMFATLFLLFVNTGPLNAAMANVLPFDARALGFAVNMTLIHVLGDAFSPALIGIVSGRTGLTPPVLATGLLLLAAGVVLLAGRAALERDVKAAAA